MIWTTSTAVMLTIGAFSLALMLYAATKAYGIYRTISKVSVEQRYSLEKNYYLLSTVVWVILLSRLAASGLFWATNESLVFQLPGAMCQFGVNQAGTPYSWLDNAVKLFVPLVYGIWVSLDFINRKVKETQLIQPLSRLFIMMTPFLFLDIALDLAFYGSLVPVTVACCRVVFDVKSQLPCPYCFVFHEAPFFLLVVTCYGLSITMVVWSLTIRHYAKGGETGAVGLSAIRKLVMLSLVFAVIGTIALIPAIIQVWGSAFFFH